MDDKILFIADIDDGENQFVLTLVQYTFLYVRLESLQERITWGATWGALLRTGGFEWDSFLSIPISQAGKDKVDALLDRYWKIRLFL
jgi:hypothetical protein